MSRVASRARSVRPLSQTVASATWFADTDGLRSTASSSRYFAQGLAEDHRATAMGALARTSIAFDSRVMFDDLTQFILERDF